MLHVDPPCTLKDNEMDSESLSEEEVDAVPAARCEVAEVDCEADVDVCTRRAAWDSEPDMSVGMAWGCDDPGHANDDVEAAALAAAPEFEYDAPGESERRPDVAAGDGAARAATSINNVTDANTTDSVAAGAVGGRSGWTEARCAWPAVVTSPLPRPNPTPPVPAGLLVAAATEGAQPDFDAVDEAEERRLYACRLASAPVGVRSRMSRALDRVAEEHAAYPRCISPQQAPEIGNEEQQGECEGEAAAAPAVPTTPVSSHAGQPGSPSDSMPPEIEATPRAAEQSQRSAPGLPEAYLTIYGKLRAAKAMAPSVRDPRAVVGHLLALFDSAVCLQPQRKQLLQALFNMGSALLGGEQAATATPPPVAATAAPAPPMDEMPGVTAKLGQLGWARSEG